MYIKNDFVSSPLRAEKFDQQYLAYDGDGRIVKVRQSHWTGASAFVIRARCFDG